MTQSRALESEKAYIMYHGTTLHNALQIQRGGFTPSSKGMLGRGVYVSRDFQKATYYPKDLPPNEERAILKVRVCVGKVKKIDCQGHPLQNSWHQNGYDTAWVPPNCGMVHSGMEENCVWDPERIEVLEILDEKGRPKPMLTPTPYQTPMMPPFGMPYQTPMMPPFGMPYQTPMMPPFGMPYQTPMMPPFGMPYQTPMMPPSEMPYQTPMMPPFGMPYPMPLTQYHPLFWRQ